MTVPEDRRRARAGAVGTVPVVTSPLGTDRATRPLWSPAGVTGLVLAAGNLDVWDLHAHGFWVLVPTNQQRRADGTAVMGAGLARQAADRFPDLAARYGRCLSNGQVRAQIPEHRLLLAPTKGHWRQPAQMALVHELLTAVARWCAANPAHAVALAAPGCGLGGLPWPDVRDSARDRLEGSRVLLLPPQAPAGP